MRMQAMRMPAMRMHAIRMPAMWRPAMQTHTMRRPTMPVHTMQVHAVQAHALQVHAMLRMPRCPGLVVPCHAGGTSMHGLQTETTACWSGQCPTHSTPGEQTPAKCTADPEVHATRLTTCCMRAVTHRGSNPGQWGYYDVTCPVPCRQVPP